MSQSSYMRRHDAKDLPAFGGEALPWLGGDLQTLKHFIKRNIERPDQGEEILIDLDDGDQLMAEFHAPSASPTAAMIAVHGLTGCVDSDHIKILTTEALARNIAVLRVNMRGAGPARHLAKKSYNAKAGADLLPFIAAVRARVSAEIPLVMVAHSIGGAAALNMMLDYPDQLDGLDGLVSVAAPIDMLASNERFHAPRNKIYMRYLLKGLKDLAERVPDINPAMLAEVRKVTTITGFDEALTAPIAGFASAHDYYLGATTAHRLNNASIPTLLIHADNDPWIPASPYLALPKTDVLDVMVSRGGGHVGFHDRGGIWSNRIIFSWLDRFSV